MTDTQIRESRMSPKYPSFPGKIEWGCLHQTLKNGPLDRVFIEDMAQAAVDVLALREKGIKAVLVSREVPEWRTEDLSVQELRELVEEAQEEERREKEAYRQRLAEEEARRRQEDDGLGWKEL